MFDRGDKKHVISYMNSIVGIVTIDSAFTVLE